MSENELLQHWAATKQQHYLNQLLEQLYTIGSEKLSDTVSKDVLHNAIIKMHNRLQKENNSIKEVKSFFLKTLYNGLMDHYKKEKKHNIIPIEENHFKKNIASKNIHKVDIEQLQKLEKLIRNKELKNARLQFLHKVLIDETEKPLSRQNKFFHRNELKKTISLLDLKQAEQLFTYTRKVLNEKEDILQIENVKDLYETAKLYKRRALSIKNSSIVTDYSAIESDLLCLLNTTIALNLYKAASSLNPAYFKPRFNVGFCYFKLDNFKLAVKEFEATLFYLKQDCLQSNYYVKMAATLRNLGTIYLLCLNDYEKALHYFTKALPYDTKDEKIRLGIIFSACKLNDEAVASNYINAFNEQINVGESIAEWTSHDLKIKQLTLDLYKENKMIRAYIPIEKII